MNESGSKRTFPSGSQRDNAKDKARMELLPYDLLARLSKWYGQGAEKYGCNNWRKGQPASAVIGSMQRHLDKAIQGYIDEDHYAAIVWNALALMNVDEYHSDNPLINDIGDWFEYGKPTGKGDYNEKI
jgi:hypothetical protein